MGVFANALSLAAERFGSVSGNVPQGRPGLGAWLAARLRQRAIKEPRLALVERISLAPRQVIALVEADGQRLLVATSVDGAPVIFPLKSDAPRSTKKRICLAEEEGEKS